MPMPTAAMIRFGKSSHGLDGEKSEDLARLSIVNPPTCRLVGRIDLFIGRLEQMNHFSSQKEIRHNTIFSFPSVNK